MPGLTSVVPGQLKQLYWNIQFHLRPLFYLGFGVRCPCCGFPWREFVPHGQPLRRNAGCTICGALERHRLLYLFLKQKTGIFQRPMRLLHMAPERALRRVLAPLKTLSYVTADLCAPKVSVHTDITRLAFPDNCFDAILCSHVLEHIPNDAAAMRELLRVLKPGGWAILQVPLDTTLATTREDLSIVDPAERRRLYGQEDHVRLYGRDYAQRLTAAGFDVSIDQFARTFDPQTARMHGVLIEEDIYYCRKRPLHSS